MKKLMLVCAICLASLLAACHFGHCAEKRLNIVAASYPVWLFAANLIEGAPDAHLELLVPADAGCPHDFSLRPADLQKLAKADILIVNGAGLEAYLTKPLGQLDQKPQIIDAGQNVPLLSAAEPGHFNEHTFAAPATAAIMAGNIGAGLANLDPANASTYASNGARFVSSLKDLSDKLRAIGQRAKNRGIILEHNGLAYLASNAGLDILATVENSASATELAKIRELAISKKPALLAGDSQYPDRLLQTLAQETDIPFAKLNICASGPMEKQYYLAAMAENLKTLEQFFAD